MPMDLDPIQDFIEEEMTDLCKIVRDEEQTADDTYDANTATYTQAGAVIVYTGKCFVSTQGWQPRDELQGGVEVVVSAFRLVLPLKAVQINLRDVVEITKSVRNPRLVGQKFAVEDRIDSSHAVSQSLLIARTARRIPL